MCLHNVTGKIVWQCVKRYAKNNIGINGCYIMDHVNTRVWKYELQEFSTCLDNLVLAEKKNLVGGF